MVYRAEEFSNVALEHPDSFGVILAFDISELPESIDRLMSSFVQPAGIGIIYKCLIEKRIKHPIQSMMQEPIPNCCLVDVPRFWIRNVKSLVWRMAIGFSHQVLMESDNIPHQIPLEYLHVFTRTLTI